MCQRAGIPLSIYMRFPTTKTNLNWAFFEECINMGKRRNMIRSFPTVVTTHFIKIKWEHTDDLLFQIVRRYSATLRGICECDMQPWAWPKRSRRGGLHVVWVRVRVRATTELLHICACLHWTDFGPHPAGFRGWEVALEVEVGVRCSALAVPHLFCWTFSPC